MSGRKETKIYPPGYEAPVAPKPSKPARKSQLSKEIVVESESSSQSEPGSDASSGSEDDSEGSGNQSRIPAGKTLEKRDQQGNRESALARPTSSSRYLLGFEPVSTPKSGAREASDVFAKSNLSGKEIWHVMIPSSVPIKNLSGATFTEIESGKTVATHNGVDYGFLDEPNTLSGSKLLVPSQTDGEYRAVDLDFAKILHLQPTSRPMNTAHREQEHGTELQPTSGTQAQPRKEARKQPKGLRLRFLPAGFRATDADRSGWSSSSEETSDKEHTQSKFHDRFQVPRGLEEPGRREQAVDSEGQGRTSNNLPADPDESRRKSKHSRHRHERSKVTSEGIIEERAHRSHISPNRSQDKSHHREQEREHKKRKAEPERDEHGRRRETSAERAKRKKKEREQRK